METLTMTNEYEDEYQTESREPCKGECCEEFCAVCEECPHDCECTWFEKNVHTELVRSRQMIKDLTIRIEKLEAQQRIDHKTIIQYKSYIDKIKEDVNLR